MTRAMGWGLALVSIAAASSACGVPDRRCGEDGRACDEVAACVARPGWYRASYEPEGGTCDPARYEQYLGWPPAPLQMKVSRGTPCGEVRYTLSFADGCSGVLTTSAEAGKAGLDRGVAELVASCDEGASECVHEFSVSFERVGELVDAGPAPDASGPATDAGPASDGSPAPPDAGPAPDGSAASADGEP